MLGLSPTHNPAARVEEVRAFAVDEASALLDAIERVAHAAPFRNMTTARGWLIAVAMTNCGKAGWLRDHSAYRHDVIDPPTNRSWPEVTDVSRVSLCAPTAQQASIGSLPTPDSSAGTSRAHGCPSIKIGTKRTFVQLQITLDNLVKIE